MSNSELIELLMGDELKLDFSLDYTTKTLALSVLQRTEEDDWNLLSKVLFHTDHPTKLARALNELTPMELLTIVSAKPAS